MTEIHEIKRFETSINGFDNGVQRDIAVNFNPQIQNAEVLTSNCNQSTVPGATVWLKKYNGFDMSKLRAHVGPNGTITDKGDIIEITMPNALYSVSLGAVNFVNVGPQEKGTMAFFIGHKHVIRIEGKNEEVRQNMNYQRIESK